MAITRVWLGTRLGVTQLPPMVRNADRYAGDGHYLDSAQISKNGLWIKLTFESGTTDYWRHEGDLGWQLSIKSPTPGQLRNPDGVDDPTVVG